MGIDVDLFIDKVDDELKCPICIRVLENPVHGINCDHIFCDHCIRPWLKFSSYCPMDREKLCGDDLRPAPKIISALLKRLDIRCVHHDLGCCWTLPLGELESHLKWCLFEPGNMANLPKNETNPLKQMRMIGDRSVELCQLRRQVEQLRESIEQQSTQTSHLNVNIEKHRKLFGKLERDLQRTTTPLMDLLMNDEEKKKLKRDSIGDTMTAVISIRNLNEFINASILTEYLRQNSIYVVSSEADVNHLQRSRDFRVIVRQSDLDKILCPQLWPRGVSVCDLSTKDGSTSTIIMGTKSKALASITIESGIIC